jgi:hypothetical protein
MNDLICSSSVMPLRDRTSNSLMCDIKSSNSLRPIIDRNHLVKKCKTRSHLKHGLLWLDCDSQIRTTLANLWEIFDCILKNGLFDAWSFWFKKESFWFQKSAPWCLRVYGILEHGKVTSWSLTLATWKPNYYWLLVAELAALLHWGYLVLEVESAQHFCQTGLLKYRSGPKEQWHGCREFHDQCAWLHNGMCWLRNIMFIKYPPSASQFMHVIGSFDCTTMLAIANLPYNFQVNNTKWPIIISQAFPY